MRALAYAAGVARVVVEVMLKPEIHDPQGEAIAAACQRLGFGQVLGVRQGKRFEVEISGPAGADEVGQIRALAAELLANPPEPRSYEQLLGGIAGHGASRSICDKIDNMTSMTCAYVT